MTVKIHGNSSEDLIVTGSHNVIITIFNDSLKEIREDTLITDETIRQLEYENIPHQIINYLKTLIGKKLYLYLILLNQ